MLVLTRRPDQTLRIGDDIEVTVVAVRGERVRLGITAPREVEINKAEIRERLRREREGRPIDRITEQANVDPLAAMVAAKNLLEVHAALHEICGRALTRQEKQQLAHLSEEVDEARTLHDRLSASYGVYARGGVLVKGTARARVIWAGRARTTEGRPGRRVRVRLGEKVAHLAAGTWISVRLPDPKWNSSANKLRLRPGRRVELSHLNGEAGKFRGGGELYVFDIRPASRRPLAVTVR